MPPRRKKENQGLPARWSMRRNRYYYHVPPGQEAAWDNKKLFKLGDTLHEAYQEWTSRLGHMDDAKTINDLMDRYLLEVTPAKAKATQNYEQHCIKELRAVFGKMPIGAILPRHVYIYADKKAKAAMTKGNDGRTSAKHHISVLSHIYTKAIEWGYINRHPFKGQVRLPATQPRTRYVEDWEVIEALSLPAMRKQGSVRTIQSYIRLKLLTGLRKSDLLRLRISDCKADGLHIKTSKTGKALIYDWTPDLVQAIETAKNTRPVHISPFIFCTKTGACYFNEAKGKTYGWDSMWQRFMARVLTETKVTEKFTEHDLRAKCASDADTLERAQELLAHADSRTTKRIYRRKPDRIAPASWTPESGEK